MNSPNYVTRMVREIDAISFLEKTRLEPPLSGTSNGRRLSGCWWLMVLLINLCATTAVAQGVLTNGWSHTGAIAAAAETDTWTIAAESGDRMIVQIAKLSGGVGFAPRIELFAPDGASLGIKSGGVAARLDIQAPVSGTYTVAVSDATRTGTGTYRLQLAQIPGAFIVPSGDEGGSLVNGAIHPGTIDVGDLDLWTVLASQGDRIVLQLAKQSGGTGFTPMLELFSPDGTRVGSDFNGLAARLDVQAESSGIYTVLVSDANQTGSGGYQLELAQAPGSFVVPAGDQGGALTDAVDSDGSILLGDLDLWSFTATAGDHITLQATELTGGANFVPMIELFAPNGERKGIAQNATLATLDVAIENGGTYSVLVSDANPSGVGTYRLHLARGSIEGPGANILTNGATSLGNIASVGASNTWTFTASVGESIVVRMGETAASGLLPWLRLYGTDGVLLAQDFNAAAAEVTARATKSGTFKVVAADGSSGRNQTGSYRINLAKTGSQITISAADEGGPMVSGTTYLATIDNGDVDTWTFTANAGENIMVRMGETASGSTLLPWLRLYGPNGVLLDANFNAGAAEVTARAAISGTFLVVAADGNAGFTGVGDYRINLARTGTKPTISASDEGGPLVNGTTYLATIDNGDVDAWTFTANAGESIVVRMGEITPGSTLLPWLRLFGPDGVQLDAAFNAAAAEVTTRVASSGTFVVVAADGNAGRNGTGNYRISLAKTGSQPTISATDEGGPLVNGTTYLATIDNGDVDAWTFTANVGESMIVRMGEMASGSTLLPWLRLYGPDGALLSADSNAGAAEVTARATVSGTFLVVAGDGTSGFIGAGNYRISLAKTGNDPTISATDEGGPLVNGTTYLATIDIGDVDAWTFTANVGESVIVRMGETTLASALLPWLRLYGPDGVLLDADFNAAAAEVTTRVANSGTFLVVAADGNSGRNGIGNYRISLAKTGSEPNISPTDEGGPLVNGTTYLATIDNGDVDAWTFSANVGESIIVRMGEVTPGSTLLP